MECKEKRPGNTTTTAIFSRRCRGVKKLIGQKRKNRAGKTWLLNRNFEKFNFSTWNVWGTKTVGAYRNLTEVFSNKQNNRRMILLN